MTVQTFARHVVRAGSFDTSYVEAGPVDAPTLVLLHDGAFGSNAELCWSEVVEALDGRFHVLAPDLLGFGETDKAVFLDRSPYAFRIDHVGAWLDALGVTDAAFAGASFGGSLLLRALVAPGSPWPVRSAMSISGTGGPFRLASGIEALADYDGSRESAVRLTSLLVGSVAGLDRHVDARLASSLTPGHWEAQNAPRLKNPALGSAARPDTFLEDLATVDVPVVFVEGRTDQLLESGWAEQLGSRTPGSKVIVGDFAHEPSIDAPELVADLLVDHLG